MKYFTLSELTYSFTATKKGIDNTPTAEHRKNLTALIDDVLDPLRAAWTTFCAEAGLGTPALTVSSGYRGFRLNAATPGSSTTSAHCVGYAADLVPNNGELLQFKQFCRDYFSTHPFDQLISEDEDKKGTPRWIHVGYKNRAGDQRSQLLSKVNGKYIPMTN